MPTRDRARYQGRVVTVMGGADPGSTRKGAKTKIRDVGFVKEVPSKEVEPMASDDPAGAQHEYKVPRGTEGFQPE